MDKSKISILIVEDDPIIAHDISIILKKAGYKIHAVVHSATKAIDRLGLAEIDFVILDIHLGNGATGIDVAQIIHNKYHIPYIFLTSFSDDNTLQAARDQAPYGYLVKPFQEATLLSTISIALGNHQRIKKGLNFEEIKIDLTAQEEKLCQGLYDGKSYQQIGAHLDISINTVRYHVKNLYLKFDVNGRSELIAKILNG